MKYSDIREEACEINKMLPISGLVDMTFGNAGVFDSGKGVFAIKPSGVPYSALTPRDMVIVNLDGKAIDGELRPSSDTPTYAELFRAFGMRALVHTHSRSATAFAQAFEPIPNFGTTHSDFFLGDIPVTRKMTPEEITSDYEKNTGLVIVECFKNGKIDPQKIQAVLVAFHAPFVWGNSAKKALENAQALEICAENAIKTLSINPHAAHIPPVLATKHFLRKHGEKAYYGQPKNSE